MLAVVVLVAGGVAVAVAGSSDSAPINKAAARGFIRAVTLQAGDLPGFAPFGGEAGSPPDATEKQESALRCGHQGKPRGRAIDAGGSLLADRSEAGVASVVVVMPSEALAKAEIATLGSRSGRRCLADGLRRSGPFGSGLYAIKITFVPVSNTLGHEAVDLHLLATLQRSGFRRAARLRRRFGKHRVFPSPAKIVYSIGAIFRVGAADVVFYAFSTRRQFPDAATERRLFSLLYSRAQVHKL
ncbi:MAG: hypothetical protein ACYDHT_03555 [Solirubrobacteraceae bacterium]